MRENVEIEEVYEIFKSCEKEIEIENIDISQGLGYILAEDIYSPMDQPPFSKSAMDGIVLKFENLEKNLEFQIKDSIYAGDNYLGELSEGEVCRIMTGAKVPKDCDIVIPQEHCKFENGRVTVEKIGKRWQNICFAGEDFKNGDLLLKRGEKLDFINLALLSSIGRYQVKVYKKIKIALLISGDEVSSPWEKLEPGKIFDSNGMLLTQRLKELGYELEVFEYLEDDPKKVAQKLQEIAERVDMIITTGGVSVGERDIFHASIDLAQGKKIFWRVNLKPGTPAMFSLIKSCPILSLSGNPFASCVTFEILGRALIATLQRDKELFLKKTKGILLNNFPKGGNRRRFVRGRYVNGKVEIPQGLHSSYALGSMRGCNLLVEIPCGSDGVKEEDEVVVWEL